MPLSRSRMTLAIGLAALLVVGGGVASATADDPPDWVYADGYPQTANDLTFSWEVASSTSSPFGGQEMLDEMPMYRLEVTNDHDDDTRYFGLGTDFGTQGVIDHLWTEPPWGAFGTLMGEENLLSLFHFELLPGQSYSETVENSSAWQSGMPAWSGHTITLFELSEEPTDEVTPTAVPIASITTPGRHVPIDLSEGDIDNLSALVGQRATVVGPGGVAELFAGLAGTVTASHLPPGEALELWITAAGENYAYFQLLGGGLPIDAVRVGTGTVAADGTLAANFALPFTLADGSYQLVAGSRAERYWPAGTYDDFQVGPPPNLVAVASQIVGGVPEAVLDLGPTSIGTTTQVQVTYPAGTPVSTTSAVVSTTGPLPVGFRFATDPPLYIHLHTTATLTQQAQVCIAYDTEFDEPPQMFHFDPELDEWEDITTVQEDGLVCGKTSSFSPIVLGHGDRVEFAFSGFFSPVSMGEQNVANPGQAIPVKFSLHGNQGLDVIESARFVSHGTVNNPSGEVIVDAVTPGKSQLTYDARADRYTYVWKTQKAWAKQTGQFILTLSDGTTHSFDVAFKK